jgi:hypothetical protein
MVFSWNSDEQTIRFGTAEGSELASTIQLVVERQPGSERWDWAIWKTGQPAVRARSGEGRSVLSATTAAETAAREWAR